MIKKEQPDLVLGMGGFASGPGGIAAWSKGIPLVLHEQNAAAGLTNRILARFANKVLMAFPGTFENAELVGNPVRKEVVALAGIRAREQKVGLNLLILGGSLGARVLNETLPLVLSNIANEKINVWHQTGKGNSAGVKQAYQDNESHQIEVDDFIQDVAKAYEWADLVICRAGALTVSELGVAGVPAIFVPLPFAVDDHQTKNAQSLVNVGAAELMAQSGLTPELLAERISVLSRQRDKLAEMARQAQAHSIADATEKVAGICKALAKKIKRTRLRRWRIRSGVLTISCLLDKR